MAGTATAFICSVKFWTRLLKDPRHADQVIYFKQKSLKTNGSFLSTIGSSSLYQCCFSFFSGGEAASALFYMRRQLQLSTVPESLVSWLNTDSTSKNDVLIYKKQCPFGCAANANVVFKTAPPMSCSESTLNRRVQLAPQSPV